MVAPFPALIRLTEGMKMATIKKKPTKPNKTKLIKINVTFYLGVLFRT